MKIQIFIFHTYYGIKGADASLSLYTKIHTHIALIHQSRCVDQETRKLDLIFLSAYY